MKKPTLKTVLAAAAALALAIQLVPYGRDHANPPVVQEPVWDGPQTRALVARACFDCHSNDVRWPWYSHIAPVSWLVAHDVYEGRATLNFSEMQRPQEEASEAAESVAEGEMPPFLYLPLHAEARLDAAERDALIAGLRASLGAAQHGAGVGGDHDADD